MLLLVLFRLSPPRPGLYPNLCAVGKLCRWRTINSESGQPCGIHARYNCLVCVSVTSVSSAVGERRNQKALLQLPALELSFGLSPILPPAPGSSSFSLCVKMVIPSVIRTVPLQKRVCGAAILIFNLCASLFCLLPLARGG